MTEKQENATNSLLRLELRLKKLHEQALQAAAISSNARQEIREMLLEIEAGG